LTSEFVISPTQELNLNMHPTKYKTSQWVFLIFQLQQSEEILVEAYTEFC